MGKTDEDFYYPGKNGSLSYDELKARNEKRKI
jgi:hypothetical protein